MRAYLLVATLGLLICAAIIYRSSATASTTASAPPSLSVTLFGFTNNPGLSRGVSGDGVGLYAVFAVTNPGPDYVRFNTVAVERNNGGGWKAYTPLLDNWPTNQWIGMQGEMWAPGSGSLYALPWPGTPTNQPWRLQLSVAKEPAPGKIVINTRIGRNLFGPGDPVRFQGPEVRLDRFNSFLPN